MHPFLLRISAWAARLRDRLLGRPTRRRAPIDYTTITLLLALPPSLAREVSRQAVRFFSLCSGCGARLELSATLCGECAARRDARASGTIPRNLDR